MELKPSGSGKTAATNTSITNTITTATTTTTAATTTVAISTAVVTATTTTATIAAVQQLHSPIVIITIITFWELIPMDMMHNPLLKYIFLKVCN